MYTHVPKDCMHVQTKNKLGACVRACVCACMCEEKLCELIMSMLMLYVSTNQ